MKHVKAEHGRKFLNNFRGRLFPVFLLAVNFTTPHGRVELFNNLYYSVTFNSLPHNPEFERLLKEMVSKNMVGKGENAENHREESSFMPYLFFRLHIL